MSEPHTKILDLFDRIGARCLWSVKGPPMHSHSLKRQASSLIEAWLVASTSPCPPRIILLHVYPGEDGVAVFSEDGIPHQYDQIEAWCRTPPPSPGKSVPYTLRYLGADEQAWHIWKAVDGPEAAAAALAEATTAGLRQISVFNPAGRRVELARDNDGAWSAVPL